MMKPISIFFLFYALTTHFKDDCTRITSIYFDFYHSSYSMCVYRYFGLYCSRMCLHSTLYSLYQIVLLLPSMTTATKDCIMESYESVKHESKRERKMKRMKEKRDEWIKNKRLRIHFEYTSFCHTQILSHLLPFLSYCHNGNRFSVHFLASVCIFVVLSLFFERTKAFKLFSITLVECIKYCRCEFRIGTKLTK